MSALRDCECVTFVNHCADVTVVMTDDGQRSVTEGNTVMVCVTLTGQLGISVVVDLTSTMGTGDLLKCYDNSLYTASLSDFLA